MVTPPTRGYYCMMTPLTHDSLSPSLPFIYLINSTIIATPKHKLIYLFNNSIMADTARTHHDITSRDQYPLLGRDRDQYPYGRSDYQTSSQDYSKTRQIAKAATAVTAGGSLLVLSSLTLVGTVIALTVATPLLVIFSPILVPALITVALLITGFLSSGGFGIAAITVFSWISSKKQRKSLQCWFSLSLTKCLLDFKLVFVFS